MEQGKTFSIHKSKKSLVDRYLDARESLRKNLEETAHRLEVVEVIDGIDFVNDARSDDLLSTRDSFKCINKPIVWIAHAPIHERDYALIEKYLKYKIKSIVAVGVNAEAFLMQIEHLVENAQPATDIDEALRLSKELSEFGDLVLYSPSCRNNGNPDEFVENGNRFKQITRELASES